MLRTFTGPLRYPLSLLDWIRRMRRGAHTRCILHNLFARELRFRNVTSDVLCRFLNALGREIADNGYSREAEDMLHVPTTTGASLVPAGKEIPLLYRPTMSRVMTAFDLGKYHGGALGLEYTQDQTEHFIADSITTGHLRAEHLRGSLRGTHPFCWLTTTHYLTSLKASTASSNLPAAIRDALGLKGLEDRHVHIIEITFPADFGQKARLHTPTIIDAGSTVFFRPHKEADGWGRAVHLKTLRAGAPEAVTPPVTITPAFKLGALGSVNRYSPGFAYERLLKSSRKMLRSTP